VWQKLQDSKPIEEESEIELDHDYDGIKELDNNLPPWWLYGFYLSIVFAVIYLGRYEVFQTAPSQIEEYEIAMAEGEKQRAEYLLTAADLVDENSVELITEESKLQEGAKIYATSCAVCHAADGGGTVGPNLVDEYWIHGGDIKDVFATIKYGVPDKGMIPWQDQLSPAKMQAVASYILSLQGTTPAAPKEPQGDKYVP
jgi:cytochrome c oxidase cbb3-type subunit 3